jgi:holo-[acyl-carrier protein] synthase
MGALVAKEKAPNVIVAVGVDIVDLVRIKELCAREGEGFLHRVYTESERAYCKRMARPEEPLAVRFAAKEAVAKCLGTGWGQGIGFAQIEVTRSETGIPGIALSGAAARRAADLGIGRWYLSLSHTSTAAVAMVVAESPAAGDGRADR